MKGGVAVDTNVLVRFLVDDGTAQSVEAARLFSDQRIFLCSTVLVEAEWVLRKILRLDRPNIERAMRRIAAIETVELEERAFEDVIEGFAVGLDFADAIHLARSAERPLFATFDEDLIKLGARLSIDPRPIHPKHLLALD